MTIKNQLKPYYNKFRIAYLIKIGLLTFMTTVMLTCVVLLISKWILIVALNQIIRWAIVGSILLAAALGWYFRPTVSWMNKEIDTLGFENRIGTYFDYKGTVNPFNEYLEQDLSNQLKKEPLFKNIKLRPPKQLSVLVIILVFITSGLSLWQTDISIKGDKIAASIETIEEEKIKLLDTLEDEGLEAEALKKLDAMTKEHLEALKEALRNEENALAEQELFKMEEAIKTALEKGALPEAIAEQLNAIGETIESKNTQSLLSALGETSLQEGGLTEANEASNASETRSEGTASGGPKDDDAAEASQESSSSETQGDGT